MTARKAYAVIGAHYGDEGKGQVTAWICRRLRDLYPDAKVLNILTNGGCQRGHTVNIPDSKFRHVFKHFGSGTPYGAHTHFGPEFIVNPMQFVKEDEELSSLGMAPVVSCGWHNRIQLPVDIAVNQFIERRLQHTDDHSGSTGFGVNETIRRYEMGIGTSMDLLAMANMAVTDRHGLFRHIAEASAEFAELRLLQCLGKGYDNWFRKEMEPFLSEGTIQHYIDDLGCMSDRCKFMTPIDTADSYDCFVFENGQGLKIGQQASKSYFGCTPSDTGAFSVLRCMSDMGLVGNMASERRKVKEVVPVYVTRTYMTRHGKGPFSSRETTTPPFGERDDQTNVPNDFQGRIRYAEFSGPADFDAMKEDMRKFEMSLDGQCELRSHVAVTHYGYYSRDAVKSIPVEPSVVFSSDQPDGIDMRDDLQF